MSMYHRIMDEILPNALMMDVDYKLFWELNPEELIPFIKAFSLKRKQADVSAWQQGMYIRMAITSSFNKDAKYPTKPMMATQEETPEDVQERIKQRFMDQVIRIQDRFRKDVPIEQ